MILVCPFCQARFLVSASVFVSGPRQMQCARCKHGWRAEAPKDPEAEEKDQETPQPSESSVTSEVQKTRLPFLAFMDWFKIYYHGLTPAKQSRIKKFAAAALPLIFLSILILKRSDIADRWPVMDKVYDAVGLHIYHYGGVGLSFEQMRSELHYDGGLTELYVEGKIHNKTTKVQEIPNILATAIGANGQVIQSWQIDAPTTRVSPDEMVTFQSSIKAPQGTVVDINLNFIETKHD